MDEIVVRASDKDRGERLDKFLGASCDLTRSFVQKLCSDGLVASENGEILNQKYKVCEGDTFIITIPEPEPAEAVPEDIPIDIVYEDENLLVVDKPQGMVVHPAAGNMTGTLVNALVFHCSLSGINGVKRPGIVHRIDKDTSGLLVVAKNDSAHISLTEQWQDKKPLRKYIALVNGNIADDTGTIDKPIARNPKDRKKMAVVYGGRTAVTHFKVLERFGAYTLIECTLDTGRTHQIRVHMNSIGHSIVGDPLYGIKKERFSLTGQLLHAATLGFKNPATGELMTFESPLPEYFSRVLENLRKNYK